jgi:hypothetical protein
VRPLSACQWANPQLNDAVCADSPPRILGPVDATSQHTHGTYPATADGEKGEAFVRLRHTSIPTERLNRSRPAKKPLPIP